MGNGMNKVLPGLYVGNYRDSKDVGQLERYFITHILSVHDSPKRMLPDKHYLCVMAADTPDQNLSQYFSICNDFIHAARLKDGNVLIHCLAGMSRSVTVTVAYIMTATSLSWRDALKVVRAGRAVANPNLGFQTQLQEFEVYKVMEERKRLKERFPSMALQTRDLEECYRALDKYETLLTSRDICEGTCRKGETCPTGVCHADPKGLRRKSSNTSMSSIKVPTRSAQSCPSSPRVNSSLRSRGDQLQQQLQHQTTSSSTTQNYHNDGLQRSGSIMSVGSYRPRSSPSGLYSYTGKGCDSAPGSVRGSRADLAATTSKETGSVIYLGCKSKGSSSTPPVSPKRSLRGKSERNNK